MAFAPSIGLRGGICAVGVCVASIAKVFLLPASRPLDVETPSPLHSQESAEDLVSTTISTELLSLHVVVVLLTVSAATFLLCHFGAKRVNQGTEITKPSAIIAKSVSVPADIEHRETETELASSTTDGSRHASEQGDQSEGEKASIIFCSCGVDPERDALFCTQCGLPVDLSTKPE